MESKREKLITMLSDSEKEMDIKIHELFDKGFTNSSSITSILFHAGFKGRFSEIRKKVEFKFRIYQQNKNKK